MRNNRRVGILVSNPQGRNGVVTGSVRYITGPPFPGLNIRDACIQPYSRMELQSRIQFRDLTLFYFERRHDEGTCRLHAHLSAPAFALEIMVTWPGGSQVDGVVGRYRARSPVSGGLQRSSQNRIAEHRMLSLLGIRDYGCIHASRIFKPGNGGPVISRTGPATTLLRP